MKKAIVLGAGLVGKAMAIDLSKKFEVTAVDVNADALSALKKHNVAVKQLDFSNLAALTAAIQPFDIVVGAVPGFLGLQTARTVIEAGKNMVDISFFPEDFVIASCNYFTTMKATKLISQFWSIFKGVFFI